MSSRWSQQDMALLKSISSNCTCYKVRRASRLITQHFDHAMAPLGIRATQFTMLVAVARMEPAKVKDLADRLAIDRTTLTRNLKCLERDGLMVMVPGSDRRERLASLSDRGLTRLQEALPVWQATQAGILRHLTNAGAQMPGSIPDWDGLKMGLARLAEQDETTTQEA